MLIKDNDTYIIKSGSCQTATESFGHINWSIFDKIYCVHYLSYADRLDSIKQQLKDVGIVDLP